MREMTNAEREVHLSMAANDRSTWLVGTDDAYWQRRFEAIGATLIEARGEWREYTLPANQVSLRNPSKLTGEQRQERAQQARERFSRKEIS